MNLNENYHVTKRPRESQQEDPPTRPRRGAWRGDLEESASHHGVTKCSPECRLDDGVLGNLAPPGNLEESASHHEKFHENYQILKNSPKII